MKTIIFVMLALLVNVMDIHAEVYEYIDSNGVTHFTDDPAKVPKKIRNTKRATTPSLTSEESKVVDFLIKQDNDKEDIWVKSEELGDFKSNIKKFSKNIREDFGDPVEPIDSRLSTPEGALSVLRHGLRTGNLTEVKRSLTAQNWKNGDGYKQMNKAQMIEMEKIFSDLNIDKKEQSQNHAVFYMTGKETDGTIEFLNFFGNWKVDRF